MTAAGVLDLLPPRCILVVGRLRHPASLVDRVLYCIAAVRLPWRQGRTLSASIVAGNDLKRAVIVAMMTMRMMQTTIDKIINVIAMRHSLVATAWPVNMRGVVTLMAIFRRAAVRVRVAHVHHVLLDAAVISVV